MPAEAGTTGGAGGGGAATARAARPRPTPTEWALLALGLVLTNHYAWLLDDAFVFFRYADNWALHELGLVYNGGEYVEGFTSPAWVLLLSALRTTGVDYWHIVRALGAIGFTAVWWMLVVLERELGPGRPRVPVPLLLIAPAYGPLCYFTSGVETPLVQVCAAGFALFLVRPDRLLPAVLVGISTLVRPELALATALAFGWVTIVRGRPPWRMALVAAGTVSSWLVFRVVYYAELLPNTFYLKHLADWGQGLLYLHETLATYRLYAIVPAALALGFVLARRGAPMRAPARIGMVVVASAIALYFVRIGGDPRHFRYLAFSYMLLAAATAGLADHALDRLAPGLGERRDRWVGVALSALGALVMWTAYPPQLDGHPIRRAVEHTMRNGINDAAYHRNHERLAIDPWSLDGVQRAPLPRLAGVQDAGVTNASWCEWAYRLPGMRVIQNLGLTDPFLARVDIRPDRPAHKSGLQPMARDLEAVHRRYTAAPGMIRLALQDGHGADWMQRNLETIEVIERKVYNAHDPIENLGLALTFPGRIEP